jgi:hypothetical protein
MKTFLLLNVFIFFFLFDSSAQNDSINAEISLDELTTADSSEMPLLPEKMIITQRALWGYTGLMRNINYFKLTPLSRQNELKIRRNMLVAHQVGGFVTLGGMIAQGIIGYKLYQGNTNLKDAHESLASFVNFSYFTTAALTLLAPPKMFNERRGFSSIKVHKALAIVHFSSMIATNILAAQLEGNNNLRYYHKVAAISAFGSFAAAMIIIKF